MVAGRLDALQPGEFGIVLGAELARALRVRPGDRVTLIAPQGLVTPAGVVPRLKQFRVVGIFEVDHYEYDSALALVHLADAQRLYQLGDRGLGRAAQARRPVRVAQRGARPATARSAATSSSATGRAATRTSSARSRSRSG